MSVNVGYVESVSAPKPVYKTYNPAVSYGLNMQTAVDVKVKIGDEEKEICGLPSSGTTHEYGDFVVTEAREAMISEIDALLHNSQSIIDSVPKHEQIIRSCDRILKELNPTYAKEQERDTAIGDLTARVNDMQDILARLETLLVKRDGNN